MSISDIFWALVSIAIFLMLVIVCVLGYFEFKHQVAIDKLKNPGKPDAAEIELTFPELSRWEMDRAVYNARKTDKQLRKYRRNYCMAGYRN